MLIARSLTGPIVQLTKAVEAAARSGTAVIPIDGPGGPDETSAVDDRDRLDRAFRRLPTDQRAILVFTHYLGLTPTEIAEPRSGRCDGGRPRNRAGATVNTAVSAPCSSPPRASST